MRFTVILFWLFMVLTATASPRRADMADDAARIADALEQYGSFEAWSDSLQSEREAFQKASGMTLPVNPVSGNIAEALKSIHGFCEAYGMDFIAVRIPAAAERAFYRKYQCNPDPEVYRLQQELLAEKVEFVEPLAAGTKPLARRLRERYAPEWTGRQVLICGEPADFSGIAADFIPLYNGGAYFASELAFMKPEVRRNRPAIVLAVPADMLSRDFVLVPVRELVRIPVGEYRPAGEWGPGKWAKLGYEPLPEKESPYFRLLPDGLLQLSPLLEGADSGMAGTVILPLPDPPGRAVRIVLDFADPVKTEVRAVCGKDAAAAGTVPDGTGARAEVRLRPVRLSRLVRLNFYVKGKVRLKAIRLYRAP